MNIGESNKISFARKTGIAVLLVLGLLQSMGYILNIPALRGIGLAMVASPLPLVFSSFRGLETFSSDFKLSVITQSGRTIETELGPKNYGLLEGPYNRRNVYGAVAAYGAKLTEGNEPKLVHAVLKYGFCSGPLLKPLQLTEPIKHAQLRVINRFSAEPLDSTLEVQCD